MTVPSWRARDVDARRSISSRRSGASELDEVPSTPPGAQRDVRPPHARAAATGASLEDVLVGAGWFTRPTRGASCRTTARRIGSGSPSRSRPSRRFCAPISGSARSSLLRLRREGIMASTDAASSNYGWIRIGTSPIIHQRFVYLLRDEEGPGQGLYAFDLQTGKEVWRRKRDSFHVSFGSPVIWNSSVVVIGDLRVKGYDVENGTDRWVVRGLSAYPCTTPAPGTDGNLYLATWSNGSSNERNMPSWEDFLAGMDKDKDGNVSASDADSTWLADFFTVFDKNKNRKVDEEEWQKSLDFMGRGKNVVLAIRPGGQGDITDSHVISSNAERHPYVSSPLYAEEDGSTSSRPVVYSLCMGRLLGRFC